jgi:pimeloyl-ACP methyl ester carboxylesterase
VVATALVAALLLSAAGRAQLTPAKAATPAGVAAVARSYDACPSTTHEPWMGGSSAQAVRIPSLAHRGIDYVGSIYRPTDRRRFPGRRPLVVLQHGNGGNQCSLAWAALTLAGHGYIALAYTAPKGSGRVSAFENAVDATRSALAFGASAANPDRSRTDTGREAIVGWSLGSIVASYLQQSTGRSVKAIVALDNLHRYVTGDTGAAEGTCKLPKSHQITPRVPALGFASDAPCASRPDYAPADLKELGFNHWRAAHVPSMELVMRGFQHVSFSTLGSDRQHRSVAYYMDAWLDLWVERHHAALSTLLAHRVDGTPAQDLLSTRFDSGAFLPPRVDTDDYSRWLTRDRHPTHGHPAPASMSKTPIVGLIDMGVQGDYVKDTPFAAVDLDELGADAVAFSGTVINANWAQLEPEPGSYDWSVIDQSLVAIQAYNNAHPATPLAAKLRVFSGNGAPAWVKTLGGSPLTLTSVKGETVTVGRWWTPAYEAAWRTFQTAMAERYDSNPLVRESAVTSCSALTGEPFSVPHTSGDITVLTDAGYTNTQEEQCLSSALGDYAAWKHTFIDYAFNPLADISGNTVSTNTAFTTQVMEQCHASASDGGPHCILGNNSLGGDPGPGLTDVYAEIDSLWNADRSADVYFQVDGPTVEQGSSGCTTLDDAVAHHAHSLELWPPSAFTTGFAAIPESTLVDWSDALRGQTQLTCPES